MAITFNWYRPIALFLAFFTVLWNSFLVVWFGMTLTGGAPAVFSLFPLNTYWLGVFDLSDALPIFESDVCLSGHGNRAVVVSFQKSRCLCSGDG
ncbi:MAG: hypothetical protein ACI9XO_004987 [Paraglaciecola sp.]|jgi:hypothetical protein